MTKDALLKDLVATYNKHGWALKSALMSAATLSQLSPEIRQMVDAVEVKDSPVDALWFSRPSHHNREAWELRLLSETQYALFESFEPDETEEQREEMRQEMEATLRGYIKGS